ncbi:transposase, MuDR, MULE transposase domain protein [Tanacetum coccineum]
MARAVSRKGLPKIIRILKFSGISRITKSIGRTNLSTLISTFSTIPIGYWINLSANSKLILVGIVKLPGSFSFDGSLFSKSTEHLSLIVMVQASSSLDLLVNNPLRYLAYLGICTKASVNDCLCGAASGYLGISVVALLPSLFPIGWRKESLMGVGADTPYLLDGYDVLNVRSVGIMIGCFGVVKKFLKNGKLEKVVAIIKFCTLNALGDLTVTLKDLFGIISGTIHYKVFMEEIFAKAITVGASLILHNVSVFSPKQSTHHYLNITKKNMVKVFYKDGGSS